MKKVTGTIIVCSLLLMLISGNAIARRSYVYLNSSGAPQSIENFPNYPIRPFNVLKYHVTLDWRKPFATQSQRFSGKNEITLQLDSSVSSVMLDAGLMIIDSVSIGGTRISPTPQPDTNEHLMIALPSLFRQKGMTMTISISYHRDTVTNRGIYFFPKGLYVGQGPKNDAVYTAEDVVYTMSEPLDAHYWMPCMDLPYDKADEEISIIAPNGITTASNGALISKQAVDANSTIWNWKGDRPIATYLMVADASNFISWSETHKTFNNPNDTLRLVYYAWPIDYYDTVKDGSEYNAQYAFRNTTNTMSAYEARFGHFPFTKYGQVPVQKFDFGGMEHQSLTTINRSWLRGDEQGMAHEMAHQWFGDKVTCRTWKDLWLNEGFATFCEAIWGESWGGYEWYMNIIRSKADGYFFNSPNEIPIYDPPFNNPFNYATTYAKPGCVIHMLRRIINNDTLFFNSLRDYTNAFAYSTAATDDFQEYMSVRLGHNIKEFIDQWIYGTMHPIYQIHWGQSASKILHIKITQKQTSQDHFTMPVKLFTYHNAVKDTITVQNDQRAQEFFQPLSYIVDSLGFDNDAIVLSRDTITFDPSLGVRNYTDASNATLQIQSDIDHHQLLCSFSQPTESGDVIELYNSIGVLMQRLSPEFGSSVVTMSSMSLPTGMYIVGYLSRGIVTTAKVQILR